MFIGKVQSYIRVVKSLSHILRNSGNGECTGVARGRLHKHVHSIGNCTSVHLVLAALTFLFTVFK